MKFVPNVVTVKAARTVLLTKKNSPTLLFAGGVVAGVGTVVTACKATLKVEEVLDDAQKTLVQIKTMVHEDYSEQDRKKDLALFYTQTSVKLLKLYGPSFVLGVTSITLLTSAHNIQNKRIAGLAASYAAVEKAFENYRGRVRAELGDEKDREFRYGVDKETTVEKTEKGEKKVTRKHFGGVDGSPYARIWGKDTSKSWEPSPDTNLFFLRSVQNWCNDKLRLRGHMFLNDVYDELGLERTSAGAVVGWVFDPKGNIEGDNYIDFGIHDEKNKDAFYDFIVGNEKCILLDFNVDGIVYDKI